MTIAYQASKQQLNTDAWTHYIGLRLLFPPILAWELIQTISYYTLGRVLGLIILPAQLFNDIDYKLSTIERFFTKQGYLAETGDKASFFL